MTEHRRTQLWTLQDRIVEMHRTLRWQQKGVVGMLVRRGRARLERISLRIFLRLAS